MDTLLAGGDHHRDSRGLPLAITGEREIIQRALIRLTVRRGSFPQDPALGSELHRLRGAKTGTLAQLALSYVQDALAPMREVCVTRVGATRTGRDTLRVEAVLTQNGTAYPLEVEIE